MTLIELGFWKNRLDSASLFCRAETQSIAKKSTYYLNFYAALCQAQAQVMGLVDDKHVSPFAGAVVLS